MAPTVSALHLYPVKSCRAVNCNSGYVSSRGLMVGKILDRSWMLIDEQNVMVSQRKEPSLACVNVELVAGTDDIADKIRLSASNMEPILLDPASVGDEQLKVIIHGKETIAHNAPQNIGAWFSKFLGKPIRVVHQKPDDVRPCNPAYAVNPAADAVSFADGYPYLLTTTTMLEKLNGFLNGPVPMNRFRPNIVVADTPPDSDYQWKSLNIGAASFTVVKPCTRCVMTTIDQDTGVKTGKEPLAMLAQKAFFAQELQGGLVQGAVFGENAIPTKHEQINVGDTVEVTDTKPAYTFRVRA